MTDRAMSVATPAGRKPIYPPVFFLIALAVMAGLHFALPVRTIPLAAVRAAGLIPIAAGLGIGIWGSNLFQRARTTIKPFDTPTTLVTNGPFRLSRNPMYLGMTLVLIGVALLLGSVTPFVIVPLFVALIEVRFIRREEKDLEAAFGAAYEAYQSRVRRWI